MEQPNSGFAVPYGTVDKDYVEELNQVNSESSKFWFDYAHDLAALPESGKMDVRPNGRLAAAAIAIERAAALDPNHIAIWAERLVIQRYLAHGLSALRNALSIARQPNAAHSERTRLALEQFKQTIDDAVSLFPDDEWFRDERLDAYEDFGWQTSE